MGNNISIMIEDVYAIMMAIQNKAELSEEDSKQLVLLSNFINKHLQRKDVPEYSYQWTITITKEQAQKLFGAYYGKIEALEALREAVCKVKV